MKNFGKIISDKDVITKEYLDSKGYISAITSKMVTDALGFTPFDSAAFTKASIKNALGIADWALAASKPSYDDVYLKLAGGTIDGSLTINGQLVGQAISNPINANVTNKWRFIYANNGIYLQAGTSDGNTAGNLYFSGYTGVAANKITFIGSTSEFSGNVAIGGSLTSAGGTISGALLVNSTLTTSGSIYCNANIKINAGGKLILGNDEGITSWSDLKSKIAYSFSEISSKPTTLSGYGITDAAKAGFRFDSIQTGDVNIIGWVEAANNWKGQGAGMLVGQQNYYTRINITGANDAPTMYLSRIYAGTAYDWVKVLTEKNIGTHAIEVINPLDYPLPTDTRAFTAFVYERDNWRTAGPALAFPDGNNKGLLNIAIGNGDTQPTILFLSSIRGGVQQKWVEVLTEDTDKIVLNGPIYWGGLDFDSLTTAGTYTLAGGGNTGNPSGKNYGNVLTVVGRNDYFVSQIFIENKGQMWVRARNDSAYNNGSKWSNWRTILDTENIGTTSLPKINLNGWTITNWNQVRMGASVLIPMTGTQILYPNEHYTYVETLTSSSNISFTLTDDTSGVSVTKIYYIVFQTGSTTPTFTFNRTLYWKDGKTLTSLAANKRYRIVIDKDLATLETYS